LNFLDVCHEYLGGQDKTQPPNQKLIRAGYLWAESQTRGSQNRKIRSVDDRHPDTQNGPGRHMKGTRIMRRILFSGVALAALIISVCRRAANSFSRISMIPDGYLIH